MLRAALEIIIVEGFADKEISPRYANVGQCGFEQHLAYGNGFSRHLGKAEMGHKDGAVDYDKSVQELSVYCCLSGQK